MQDDQEFRWGLAGYGNLAERRLVDALNHPPHRIVAVWGRNFARASAFAGTFGIPRTAASLHELTKDVDAVYVATPPVAHLSVATAAVRAGRQVLIEKPLSPTFDGYEDLVALVAKARVRAAVGYYRRCAPVIQSLRHVLAKGRLGSVRSVELNFVSRFKLQDHPHAWRLDRSTAGGGVTADAGSHRLDLLTWLFGESHVVQAKILRTTAGNVDCETEMTLAFASGVSAQCRFAWGDTESGKVDRLVIVGEAGTAKLDPLDSGHLTLETKSGTQVWHEPPPPNLHRVLAERFRRWVVSGSDESLCTLSQAHAVDVLLETVYIYGKKAGGP